MFKRIRARKKFIHSPSLENLDATAVVPYGFKLLFGVGRYHVSIYSKGLMQ